jgi:hypothetical protein
MTAVNRLVKRLRLVQGRQGRINIGQELQRSQGLLAGTLDRRRLGVFDGYALVPSGQDACGFGGESCECFAFLAAEFILFFRVNADYADRLPARDQWDSQIRNPALLSIQLIGHLTIGLKVPNHHRCFCAQRLDGAAAQGLVFIDRPIDVAGGPRGDGFKLFSAGLYHPECHRRSEREKHLGLFQEKFASSVRLRRFSHGDGALA